MPPKTKFKFICIHLDILKPEETAYALVLDYQMSFLDNALLACMPKVISIDLLSQTFIDVSYQMIMMPHFLMSFYHC